MDLVGRAREIHQKIRLSTEKTQIFIVEFRYSEAGFGISDPELVILTYFQVKILTAQPRLGIRHLIAEPGF